MEAPREAGLELQQELELFPGRSVALLLFTGVQNAAALRRKAMEGAVEGALLNPAMVRGAPVLAGGGAEGPLGAPLQAPWRGPSASCEGSSV